AHDETSVSFSYTVTDGTINTAGNATLDITPVNDAPTAATNTVVTNEDTDYTFAAADFNFADIDGDALASIQITTLESAGSLQLNGGHPSRKPQYPAHVPAGQRLP
ncbi:MAG: hypothetical protein HKN34_07855, partial [Gammaproteobacteria bacterium]|nr:hypothetical protein [Gammaproteobacteria bacterium]